MGPSVVSGGAVVGASVVVDSPDVVIVPMEVIEVTAVAEVVITPVVAEVVIPSVVAEVVLDSASPSESPL